MREESPDKPFKTFTSAEDIAGADRVPLLRLGAQDERQAPRAPPVSDPARTSPRTTTRASTPRCSRRSRPPTTATRRPTARDPWTARAEDLFREHFGADARGLLRLQRHRRQRRLRSTPLTRPHEAVICTESAHLNVDECGAPERLAGAKLLTVADRARQAHPGRPRAAGTSRRGDEHSGPARASSRSPRRPSSARVYTPTRSRAIADAAHARACCLHVDGARLANAAASLGVSLGALTTDAGVDVLSFGGTKNGLMFGEAVVFCARSSPATSSSSASSSASCTSKMRFVAAQFEALLSDDLWLRSARTRTRWRRASRDAVEAIDGVEIVHPVEANAVFARLERRAIDQLLEALPSDHPFYVWDEADDVVRWMCAWDTQPGDVDGFADAVRQACA